MFCKNCGKEIEINSKFCEYCGYTLNNTISEDINSKKKKKKKKNKITGIIPGIILIIFLILIGMIATQTSNNTHTNTEVRNDTNTKGSLITLNEFNQIETGMSYKEVVSIIGSNGTLSSETNMAGYHTQIFTWYGGLLGENANVTFQNGKVVGKAQAGLK